MGCAGSKAKSVTVEGVQPEVLDGKATEQAPPAEETVASPKQSALVFTKPHANTPAVRSLVAGKFSEAGIKILTNGEIAGPKIDAEKLIDQHYYAIASKATIFPAADLPVPAWKFKSEFGEEWATVLAEGRAFNAMATCEHLAIDATELNKMWSDAEKRVKFGGGFYCAELIQAGKPSIYTFNAFFMTMRGKFTAADASIHFYVVEFDPCKLSWADFRGKVLGPTDPAKAPADSLRGLLHADWEKLGLTAPPNTGDNGVHASASPFEGLAERMNWLSAKAEEDPFGKLLLAAGMSEETIKAWSVDPRVPMPDGSTGSLFDALEDLDLDDCIKKAVAINGVGTAY